MHIAPTHITHCGVSVKTFKCNISFILKDNTDALDDLQFNPQKMSVLTNVVGAIAEGAKSKTNIHGIR